jgi:hypothetical protein
VARKARQCPCAAGVENKTDVIDIGDGDAAFNSSARPDGLALSVRAFCEGCEGAGIGEANGFFLVQEEIGQSTKRFD